MYRIREFKEEYVIEVKGLLFWRKLTEQRLWLNGIYTQLIDEPITFDTEEKAQKYINNLSKK